MEIEGEDQKLSLHQDLESNSLRGPGSAPQGSDKQ
ncbi:unnamed protein product [Brassica oleracea var. botrytis]